MTPPYRLIAVLLILAASGTLAFRRAGAESVPAAEPLTNLPGQIDGLVGSDRAIDPGALEVLGSGKFISRLYTKTSGPSPVDLFIAYFPSQKSGNSIHSPKHCLPGAGWFFESSSSAMLTGKDGKPYRVGEYVVTNGSARQFVIYWYYAHGRSVSNEYWAKYYLIRDAIHSNRTDGALVRVITPILSSESTDSARARAVEFTQELAPTLNRYIPD